MLYTGRRAMQTVFLVENTGCTALILPLFYAVNTGCRAMLYIYITIRWRLLLATPQRLNDTPIPKTATINPNKQQEVTK